MVDYFICFVSAWACGWAVLIPYMIYCMIKWEKARTMETNSGFNMLIYTTPDRMTPEGLQLVSSGDILPLTSIANAFRIDTPGEKKLYYCRVDNPTLIDLASAINARDIESWEAVTELGIQDVYAGRTIEEARLIFPELDTDIQVTNRDGSVESVPLIPPLVIL